MDKSKVTRFLLAHGVGFSRLLHHRYTYLSVREAQHGGQLPSVGLCDILLYFEALLETFAL